MCVGELAGRTHKALHGSLAYKKKVHTFFQNDGMAELKV